MSLVVYTRVMNETSRNRELLYSGIELVRASSWGEVRQVWQDDEDTDTFRREYKEQGFETWDAWRRVIIEPLHLERLQWRLYSVKHPELTVPCFRGGPYVPWKELYYGDKELPNFADIVALQDTDVHTRDKFREIIGASKPIRLIGLRQSNDIFIVEGMHRSTSLALAASRGQSIEVPVQLYLADSDLDAFPMIG